MNAKEYLSQAFKLDQKINSKLDQIASLRALAKKATASIHAERVSGTGKRGPMENALVKLIDLEHEISDDIDRYVDSKREIMSIINAVKTIEFQLLLELRYLNYKTWKEVGKAMKYSCKEVHYTHSKALYAVRLNVEASLKNGDAGS